MQCKRLLFLGMGAIFQLWHIYQDVNIKHVLLDCLNKIYKYGHARVI